MYSVNPSELKGLVLLIFILTGTVGTSLLK